MLFDAHYYIPHSLNTVILQTDHLEWNTQQQQNTVSIDVLGEILSYYLDWGAQYIRLRDWRHRLTLLNIAHNCIQTPNIQ